MRPRRGSRGRRSRRRAGRVRRRRPPTRRCPIGRLRRLGRAVRRAAAYTGRRQGHAAHRVSVLARSPTAHAPLGRWMKKTLRVAWRRSSPGHRSLARSPVSAAAGTASTNCGCPAERLARPLDYAREVPLLDRDDEREPRVAPGRVSEELLDGLAEPVGPRRDLALSDEDDATAVADEDVGLSFEVEDRGASLALVGAVVEAQRTTRRRSPSCIARYVPGLPSMLVPWSGRCRE